MTKPKKQMRPFHIGKRFSLPEGTKPAKRGNKLSRRVLRAHAKRGRVDKELAQVRDDDLEIAQLATNSHQRQRAIAQDRKER